MLWSDDETTWFLDSGLLADLFLRFSIMTILIFKTLFTNCHEGFDKLSSFSWRSYSKCSLLAMQVFDKMSLAGTITSLMQQIMCVPIEYRSLDTQCYFSPLALYLSPLSTFFYPMMACSAIYYLNTRCKVLSSD